MLLSFTRNSRSTYSSILLWFSFVPMSLCDVEASRNRIRFFLERKAGDSLSIYGTYRIVLVPRTTGSVCFVL